MTDTISSTLPIKAPSFLPGYRLPNGDDLQGLRNLGYSSGPSMTAHAGGGFAHATGIIYASSTIGICASTGDSVKLPLPVVGLVVSIINAGAASARIFGYRGGDLIDGTAGNVGILLPSGENISLRAISPTTWVSESLSVVVSYATRADAVADVILGSYARTAGYYVAGDNGGALYIKGSGTTAGGFQDASGQWWKLAAQDLTFEMFGAKGDDTTNDATAWNSALSVIGATGGMVSCRDGAIYKFTSQVTLTYTVGAHAIINGKGAVLHTGGAISALKFVGYVNEAWMIVVRDLTIDHQGNGAAYAGFDVSSCIKVHFCDCGVIGGNNAAGYAAWWVHRNAPGDVGSYWCEIDRCTLWIGLTPGLANMPCGVRLQGYANAARIINSIFTGIDNMIELIPDATDTTYTPNGVLISGNAFETAINAIYFFAGPGVKMSSGVTIVGNRTEDLTTSFVNLAGDTAADVPPQLDDNAIGEVAWIVNPYNHPIDGWLFSYVPTVTSTGGNLTTVGAVSGHVYRREHYVTVWGNVAAVDIAGASGFLKISLPYSCVAVLNTETPVSGTNNSSFKGLSGQVTDGFVYLALAGDGAFPIANGQSIRFQVCYWDALSFG